MGKINDVSPRKPLERGVCRPAKGTYLVRVMGTGRRFRNVEAKDARGGAD